MSLLLHILKFRLLTFIKFQDELNIKSILKQLSASVVYIVFAICIFFFTQNIITYLMEDVRIGMFLLHRFVFVVLFIFFMTVNIGNIVVSYSTFFKTREVGFLLTMPISFAKIFIIKFLDNFFYSSSTLLLMVTAAIAGYTSYFGLPWYFIPFAVMFLILPFMFIAGTLGAITLLVIMRSAATFGIKKVLVTIASVYGTATILFYLFALYLAKKWFYKTWLVFLNLSSELSVKKKSNGKTIFSFENESSLKPRREALLKREFLLFIREPSQWTHFLVMTFLITIFIISISNIDVMILNAYNIYLKTLIYLIIYLFNVFLIASMSLRFIFPLVSLEGETIWKIRSAPVNYKMLMLTRLFIYFSVIFVIGQLLNFVSNYQFSILLTLISQLNTAFVTITLVSLNFGMGAVYANYKEKNPIRVASSQGASLSFLFTIIYLVFLILLLFAPLSNYFYAFDKTSFAPISQLLYTSVILGTIAFIMSYLSISKGVRHFNKD